eukprot:scaffold18704_cov47-Phaeocystis_antarctica.AAC.1
MGGAALLKRCDSEVHLAVALFVGGIIDGDRANPQNGIGVAIPRNQRKLVSSPCITSALLFVRRTFTGRKD